MAKLRGRISRADNKEQKSRIITGAALCIAGMAANILLFLLKRYAGSYTGSIAITADAYNNLADAGSSLIALLGFQLSFLKPTKKHPYGFGRIEYLSGLFISAAILTVGIKLFLSSLRKIISPERIGSDITVTAILTASIAVKSVMYIFYRKYGKKMRSTALKAAAADSLSDCFATFAIICSGVVGRVFSFNIDGWCGVMVAVCILWAGIGCIKDAVSPLLGGAPDSVTQKCIENTLSKYGIAYEAISVTLHDYGPFRRIVNITLHPDDAKKLGSNADEVKKSIDSDTGCESSLFVTYRSYSE